MKKIKIYLLVIIAISLIFTGCEIDNYNEPNVFLTGSIVYNGEPLNLSNNEVTLQILEEGWELETPNYAYVNQTGEYSFLTFKGSYTLQFASGQGPFKPNQESISVELDGDKVVNYEVTPYYLVRSANFSTSGQNVAATFEAAKIITDASNTIQTVYLYVSKTSFVDKNTAIATATLSGGNITNENSISLNVDYPTLVPDQDYIFARVGIKISGVEDMIFSEVIRLDI
ncbi:DUF3823 domain-containing protein [Maribellus comscasis]|uniref:DUF3823 domain-containing protein n=1 Tax=Maribellus comscasis TaxID=2681766 RepID=A0A6I6JYE7_9BACT|nr:DUF3823 domain-containing protein [Maribellus comscasis]QGY47571.1 DUF3823 domain-containing protein [Maribellus comscasis]